MTEFKKGDTVRVILAPLSTTIHTPKIRDGQLHTVDRPSSAGTCVYLVGLPGLYANSRFELVTRENGFNVGDRVRVLDDSGQGSARIGDEGTVTSVGPEDVGGRRLLCVDTDRGVRVVMFAHRFKLVEETYCLKDGEGDWWWFNPTGSIAGPTWLSDAAAVDYPGFEEGIATIDDEYDGIDASEKEELLADWEKELIAKPEPPREGDPVLLADSAFAQAHRVREKILEEDQRVQAWYRVAEHPFFKSCYDAEGSLIDAMIAKLDGLKVKPEVAELTADLKAMTNQRDHWRDKAYAENDANADLKARLDDVRKAVAA